ncbi:MAG: copper chaperone PCu(A)C [Deinococcus sp.]|nr:copper chaperone PCu(A)C [Deinococcus sp.]
MTTGPMTPHFTWLSRRRGALLPLLLLPGLLVGCQTPAQETATSTAAQSSQASQAATSEASAGSSAHAGHDMASQATASAPVIAGSAGALPLEVASATVTAVPPSLGDTAAYLTLRNPTDEDIVLVGASTPAAGHAMLMQTMTSADSGTSMSGMVEVPSLTVPAGGELKMASGGDHVMLMGLTQPLEEGREVALTLQAQDGRTLDLRAAVQRP